MASNEIILVLNSGSSSLKFALFSETQLLEGSATGIGKENGSFQLKTADNSIEISVDHVMETQSEALQKLANVLQAHPQFQPVSVGHRVVHGGPALREHQRITADVLGQLEAAVHFAPLHIPQALTLIRQAQKIFPDIPHFACFDNVFHHTMPPVSMRLPLPKRYEAKGVIHYGFHGLSYESIVTRLNDKLPRRAIFAHLGSGSSVCAVLEGRSIDTTMGMTPTGGIPMGSRSGDLDPGVLLYLMRTENLNADQLERFLNQECGLSGLTGGESNMQTLLKQADVNPDAKLAIAIFCTAVRKAIGAYAALLGGLDLLVFTGGIGANSPEIRAQICKGLSFLGLDANLPNDKIMTMPAAEESQIVTHCRQLLSKGGKV